MLPMICATSLLVCAASCSALTPLNSSASDSLTPLARNNLLTELERLEAEAARLGIKGRVKVLEEGETMHLSSVARIL